MFGHRGRRTHDGRRVVTPRLVATDLDGTIVRTDGSIGPRTVEMIVSSSASVSFGCTGSDRAWRATRSATGTSEMTTFGLSR